MNIAVLITVYNRKKETLICLHSLQDTLSSVPDAKEEFRLKVFLTDDGCTDGTSQAIADAGFELEIIILQGSGSLFWNGGMINSWKAAINDSIDYDGYLWLNDDTVVLDAFWKDLRRVDAYSLEKYGKHGIYCGSTKDPRTGKFTYGGFRFVNKFTLKDELVLPDGKNIQACEACHGNITYVSNEVVEHEGIFCEKYIHGGTDHDYSYLAHKHGFPVLVMPDYCGDCVNDHLAEDGHAPASKLSKRNFHNSLLFNWRCFPWRVPLVFMAGLPKLLFPKLFRKVYLHVRR